MKCDHYLGSAHTGQKTRDDKWAPIWLFSWLLRSEHENKIFIFSYYPPIRES